MSNVTSSSDFGNIADFEALKRWVTVWAGDVTGQINGGIDFSSNIYCRTVDAVFSSANADLAIQHNLGKLPTGYMLVKTDVASIIYTGSGTWTTSVIYLKASVAATCKVLIF